MVNVTGYYTRPDGSFQGARGSFDKVKLYFYLPETHSLDSLTLDEGLFDYRFSY
jgi:hypothetical protein